MKEQSAHEPHCAVAQKLIPFTYLEMAEGRDLKTPKPQRL